MDKIAFPYRAPQHLALLHVLGASEAWQKYDLDVDYNRHITRADAHSAIANGDVEFVGGNHVSTYGRHARGDRWVYLGNTVNTIPDRKLVVRTDSGINGIADLRHKTVGTLGHHPGLNDWLYLKQHGLDVDRDDVVIVHQAAPSYMKGLEVHNAMAFLRPDGKGERQSIHRAGETDPPLWQWVRDGYVDAAFLWPPATDYARNAGLKLIEIEPMAMINFTTPSTSVRFVEQHPDIVERFLKGMIEGIHYFKTNPETAIGIIRERYTHEGQLDQELATTVYRNIADSISPGLFPTPDAIANVYVEGIRDDKDAAKVNPFELWDLQFVRKLEESGFVKRLYGQRA